MEKLTLPDGRVITVIEQEEADNYLTEEDKEMDIRVKAAVEAAITKAKICKKPIAYYDSELRKSYIEYPDGRRKYDD